MPDETNQPVNPPATPANSPPASSPTIDKIASELQSGAQAAADAAQAVDQAAATAQAITGEIHGTTAPAAIPDPAPDAHLQAPPATPDIAKPPLGPTDSPLASDAAAPGDTTTEPKPLQVSKEVQRLLAIEVPIIVQLGIRRMTVQEVMRFAVGAIIEFSKSAEEEMELLANNMTIGKGQAVKVGENFGIKISSIGSVKEMIRKLGGA